MFNAVALKSVDLSNKDMGKLVDVSNMFYNVEAETINLNNCSFEKVTNAKNFIGGSPGQLTTIIPPKHIKTSITFTAPKMSDESIEMIIENLETVTTSQVLTLGSDLIKRLTEEQMATILDKNWSVN